jgi:hypothetical protein
MFLLPILISFVLASSAMPNPDWPPSARPPFRTDIPEPILVDPPADQVTKEGLYIPASKRPYVKLEDDSRFSHLRQLYQQHEGFRVHRWILPSWGWVGIRTYYGHSDAEWEAFRRRLLGAYYILEIDEAEKFRIL